MSKTEFYKNFIVEDVFTGKILYVQIDIWNWYEIAEVKYSPH